MPSERVQRQIDTLLDQAEESTASREWDSVLESVAGVLALDGENEDALAFRAMAEQARDAGSSEVVIPDSSPAVANPASYNRPSGDDSPTSSASGRRCQKRSFKFRREQSSSTTVRLHAMATQYRWQAQLVASRQLFTNGNSDFFLVAWLQGYRGDE